MQTNLEVFGIVFGVEVKIYQLNAKSFVLTCSTTNLNKPKTARLLKSRDSHYDTLFEDDRFAGLGVCQNIVLNVDSRPTRF